MAYAMVHPLDTLKTRMQASIGKSSSGSGLPLKSLFTRDTARVLARGFYASVIGAGPQVIHLIIRSIWDLYF